MNKEEFDKWYKEERERIKKIKVKPPLIIPKKEKLTKKQRAKKSFAFVLTKVCNLNCPFCIWKFFPKEKNTFVSPKFFEEVLIKMKKENYNHVGLVGGEIWLHPQFKEIINICVKHKFKFTFVSNAKEWEKYKFIFETPEIKKYFDSCAVSLDGEEQTHDNCRGKGSYKKVIEFLEYLKTKGGYGSIKMVLRQDNYKDIMHVFEVAKKYNKHFEAFGCDISDIFTLKQDAVDYLLKFVKKNKKMLQKHALKAKKKVGVVFLFDINKGIKFCSALDDREFVVFPDGKCKFCCGGLDHIIGDIKTDTVQKILEEKCKTSLYLVNRIFPIIHGEMGFLQKDKCAMCRHFLGYKE